jgi:hypothetical protein
MAVLLGLPNEAVLRIFHYLPKSVKHPKPQADLLNLSLTCKQLAPLAREVLFTAPILHPCRIDTFLATIFKYPDIQSKIQSLTVESNKIHRSWMVSDDPRVWGQDAKISLRCAGILQASDLNEGIKQEYCQVLQRKYGWLGNLLSLVLILLPNLSSLSLGGAPFSHPTFLNPVCGQDPYLYPSLSKMDHIRTPPQLSAKLTFLELPSGVRLLGDAKGSRPTFFPELRHLMLSFYAVMGTSAEHIIPPKLETLVLTECTELLDHWLNKVAVAHRTSFPSLHSLSIYGQKFQTQDFLFLRHAMKRLGITCKSFPHSSHVIYSTVAHEIFSLTLNVFDGGLVYEYVPKRSGWSLCELHHPWFYTRVELDAFNSMRCKEEIEKWEKGEWELMEGWEVGEWEVEESEGEESEGEESGGEE